MKTNNIRIRFTVWGVAALMVVSVGGLLARSGIAQERPLIVTGADVPPAYIAGHPERTIAQMRKVYEILKEYNWDASRVPAELQHLEDQQYDEQPYRRDPKVGGIAFPADAVYNEVAFYVDVYYRRNQVIYAHSSTSRPEGFYLVMFKSGILAKVVPQDVRMYPHPTIPDALLPVFPGMSVYKAGLPKLPEFQ